MAKFRVKRRLKRKFIGNRHTVNAPTVGHVDGDVSASAAKLANLDDNCEVPMPDPLLQGNRIIDMEILSSVFAMLACPECKNTSLSLEECSQHGISFSYAVVCGACAYVHSFESSKKTGSSIENNLRLVYAMRQLGKGYSGAVTLAKVMNMPPPPWHSAYQKISAKLCKAAENVASKSMMNAATEVRCVVRSTECGVSGDGTWQRRGHSSLNGCVSLISIDTGKIIDVEGMSSKCRACHSKSKLSPTSAEFLEWKANHTQCQANYTGSAGGMEAVGLYRMFERAERSRGLKYVDFYGDGDSKSHAAIKDIYGPNSVRKLECIGHVQKRVGCRLRKLKKTVRGLGGKGKLTDVLIDRLQNYYGIAIRTNVGDLQAMKQATLASLFHCSSTDETPRHGLCPLGPESWCGFNRRNALGSGYYKHKGGLSNEVLNKVKPVYADLCTDELLKKCLHGKTQNANECFNGMIWQRVPKDVHMSLPILLFGLYDAVCHFNDGNRSVLAILKEAGIEPGHYTIVACYTRDQHRVRKAQRQSTGEAKQHRKKRRAATKAKKELMASKEGPTYVPGGF